MKPLCAALCASIVLTIPNAFAAPPVVNPEQMDLDANISAKIGLEKAKRNKSTASMNQGGSGGEGGSDSCGTVNINSNEKKSNSGLNAMFGKQSTTIVTGPVINMANCK